MSSRTTHILTSFIAAVDIAAATRVKYNGAMRVGIAGAGDHTLGYALLDTGRTLYKAGDAIGLQVTAPTVYAIASAAIADGAKVKPAANGKVATAGAGDSFSGIALEAAAADGDVIEVLPLPENNVLAPGGVTAAKLDLSAAKNIIVLGRNGVGDIAVGAVAATDRIAQVTNLTDQTALDPTTFNITAVGLIRQFSVTDLSAKKLQFLILPAAA